MSGTALERRNGNKAGGTAPPHDLDAEQAVVAAALINPDILDEAGDQLAPDAFHGAAHGHIWESMLRIRARGDCIDPYSVAADIAAHGLMDAIGGPAALTTIQNTSAIPSKWPTHARRIIEQHLRRRMIGIAAELDVGARDPTVPADTTAEHAQSAVFALDDRRQRSGSTLIAADIDTYLEELDARITIHAGGGARTGVPWGLHCLDEMTLGLHPGQLIIVGARPSMGKTALLLGTAIAAAKDNRVVHLASLEMSIDELRDRYVAARSIISLAALRAGNLTGADRLLAEDWLRASEDLLLAVDDEPGRTVAGIASSARRTRSRHGRLDLIIVDYLQLISSERRSDNRAVDLGEISRGLKILARQLEVPILAASQLSRNLESRTEKRPMLSDLRESGSLEQDADIVAFIFRDFVYHPDKPGADPRAAEINIAKQRNGPTGTRQVTWDGATTRFMDSGSQHQRGPCEDDSEEF